MDIYIYIYGSGWWLNPTPLKNMKINWDDEIPKIWRKKMFQTTNQTREVK